MLLIAFSPGSALFPDAASRSGPHPFGSGPFSSGLAAGVGGVPIELAVGIALCHEREVPLVASPVTAPVVQ